MCLGTYAEINNELEECMTNPEERKRLLAVFAHPDDEAFGTGGTLSRYAEEGTHVVLVCATRGEAGEISDPDLATPETLGQKREEELECAVDAMGVAELVFLDYRDSGMAGTPENEDSRAYINAPTEEVVSKLVGIIRRVRPHVVVTFEPNGGYGHPDHIAAHRHTVAAFAAAADANRHPEQGPAWQADRLFYTAIPRSFFQQMGEQMEAAGIDTSQFSAFEEAGWPDDQVHVTLDVSDSVEGKWDALSCHRTQFGPQNLFRRLPQDVVKRLMSYEHFALAWPEPEAGLRMEDLFEGM
jgi:N-acetyl-1-D-myo-inositol-2-amino-2-deoxy-alpha-D-glucopyranoside deacetylase